MRSIGRRASITILILGGLVSACATCPRARTVDPQVLMDADRAFAKAVAAGGLDAWVSFFDDEGEQIPARAPVTRGKDAIRALMDGSFDTPDAIVWEPKEARVAASGDIGYTIGES